MRNCTSRSSSFSLHSRPGHLISPHPPLSAAFSMRCSTQQARVLVGCRQAEIKGRFGRPCGCRALPWRPIDRSNILHSEVSKVGLHCCRLSLLTSPPISIPVKVHSWPPHSRHVVATFQAIGRRFEFSWQILSSLPCRAPKARNHLLKSAACH